MRMSRYWLAISIFAALFSWPVLARPQSFDLTNGRVPVASLDGLWRFHTGDDPAWANPNFDDSQWPLLRSDKDWAQQGYKGYSGIAWYRFRVALPAGLDDVSILLPTIRTCYEVYADGQLIGTYGKMPPNKMGYSGGGHHVYKLPAGKHSDRPTEIALRVWQFPGWAGYIGGGAYGGGGIVGDTGHVESQFSLDQTQSLWNNSAEIILALLQDLAGIGALALFVLRRKEREYLWFGVVMLSNAAGDWIYISGDTTVWRADLYAAATDIASCVAWLAIPLFYQQLFKGRRSWFFIASLALLAADLIFLLTFRLSGFTKHVWLLTLIDNLCGLPITYWIFKTLFLRAREGSPDARLLLLPQIPYTAVFLIDAAALVTYQLGWQHSFSGDVSLTATPFPVSLDQVAYALFPLAVFGILVLRFTRTRSEEERYAGEVQAARSVQQYLIPEQLPLTPGLAIESVYRPSHEVGGDFFQVIPDAADESVLIVVGDVAGHGMEAGMLATLIVGGIRMAAFFTTDPERILSLLNKRMRGAGWPHAWRCVSSAMAARPLPMRGTCRLT